MILFVCIWFVYSDTNTFDDTAPFVMSIHLTHTHHTIQYPPLPKELLATGAVCVEQDQTESTISRRIVHPFLQPAYQRQRTSNGNLLKTTLNHAQTCLDNF